MVTSTWLYLAFLASLYGERFAELVVSHLHSRRAFALGAAGTGRPRLIPGLPRG
jgi:hypothetical protein